MWMSERRNLLKSLVRPLTPAEQDSSSRLVLAFDMMQAGLAMKRQSLQRLYPDESPQQITTRLQAWVQHQPVGAEFRCRQIP